MDKPAKQTDRLLLNMQQEIKDELEQAQRALKEVNLMLEQSQVELTKLTQRNTSITTHLQQMQPQFEAIPRPDIRNAYSSALETQQRLWVVRGQIEKWQSDQVNLQKLVIILEKVDRFLSDDSNLSGNGKQGGKSGILDMLIAAQETERKRLSRQMHDGPAQTLSNFIVQTEIAARMFDTDPKSAKEELSSLKTAAMGAFQKVRSFIFELRPMMLDDLGLAPTLRRYIDAFKEQNAFDITLDIKDKDQRLDPTLEVVIFRSLQELMGAAARHNINQPTKTQINIQLIVDPNFVRASVSDNGRGYEPEALEKIIESKEEGIGLKLIRERIGMLGGNMDIDTAVGKGCKFTLQIPYGETGSI